MKLFNVCSLVLMLLAASTASAQRPAEQLGSLSPDQGLYSNRIAAIAHSWDYTEVCIKDGAVLFDLGAAGAPTFGGNCEPGDVGWIIEQAERVATTWEDAKLQCLKEGLRLPEPLEFKVSCTNAAAFGLSGMTDNDEWTSNSTTVDFADGQTRLMSKVLGSGGCQFGGAGTVAVSFGFETVAPHRCAR